MGFSSISGRAPTNPSSPRAFAVCQRCNFWFSREHLVWQHEYRGPNLENIQLLVCPDTCLDIPHQFGRPLYLPPDPPPVWQPRVEQFSVDEAGPYPGPLPPPFPTPVHTWDGGEFWDTAGLTWDDGVPVGATDWDAGGSWDTGGSWDVT